MYSEKLERTHKLTTATAQSAIARAEWHGDDLWLWPQSGFFPPGPIVCRGADGEIEDPDGLPLEVELDERSAHDYCADCREPILPSANAEERLCADCVDYHTEEFCRRYGRLPMRHWK